MCAVALRRSERASLGRLAFTWIRGSVPGLHRVLRSTLSERARAGKDWLYEIKADGYRAQLHLRAGRTTIYSANEAVPPHGGGRREAPVAPSKEQLKAYWEKSYKEGRAEIPPGRPLKLVRHTHGITFYHRGTLPPIP